MGYVPMNQITCVEIFHRIQTLHEFFTKFYELKEPWARLIRRISKTQGLQCLIQSSHTKPNFVLGSPHEKKRKSITKKFATQCRAKDFLRQNLLIFNPTNQTNSIAKISKICRSSKSHCKTPLNQRGPSWQCTLYTVSNRSLILAST
jgi:hypothetical protein